MRKLAAIAVAVLAFAMLTATVAIAGNGKSVEELDVIAEYEAGVPVVGMAKLIRRANGLKATAKVSGLEPGGVYTFWWVIPSETHPVDSFAALGGSKVVSKNGKATVRMRANINDPSIDGFFDHLDPLGLPLPEGASFVPLTADLLDDKIRIEVAYHGNVDSGEYNPQWELDFWTGQAEVCPDAADFGQTPPVMAVTGQPHCPTFYAAESQAMTP